MVRSVATVESARADRIRIGAFTFDGARGGLFGDDGTLRRLRPKAYKLLAHFLAHPHRTLDRTSLADIIWPGVHVTPDSLTHLVLDVRRAIGDVRGSILQTVPGRGYVYSPAAPAAVASKDARNLVAPWSEPQDSRLIGRQGNLAALMVLVGTHRLVTITGIGGIGKSRLLLHLATDLAAITEEMHWIDLAAFAGPSDLWSGLSRQLGVVPEARKANQAMIDRLRHRPCILLMDNAERALSGAGPMLGALLAECPDLTIIATSRAELRAGGERVYRLEPLVLPPAAFCRTWAMAMRFSAVQLFAELARSVVPGLQLGDAAAEAVVDICRRLDGIPLALGMAARRLGAIPPERIRADLAACLRLLAVDDGEPAACPMQQALEQSWSELWGCEREFLEILSVFEKGASATAIIAMQSAAEVSGDRVLDGLADLVRVSLVEVEPGLGGDRYRLLNTVRSFVRQRMTQEQSAAMRLRHLLALIETFEAAERQWATTDSHLWLQRLMPDTEDLRSALAWAFGAGQDVELGVRLVSASFLLWWELPGRPLLEGRHWITLATQLAGCDTPIDVQARLLLGASWLELEDGNGNRDEAARRVVALLHDRPGSIMLGAALWLQGRAALLRGTWSRAGELFDEAIALLAARGPNRWLVLALLDRGDTFLGQHRTRDAIRQYQEAYSMARHTLYFAGLQGAGHRLAETLLRNRVPARPRPTRHALPHGERVSFSAISLAVTATATDGTAEAFAVVALELAEAGELRQAARLLGYIQASHTPAPGQTGQSDPLLDHVAASLSQGLRRRQQDELRAEGSAWTEQEALAIAAFYHDRLSHSVPALARQCAG